MKKIFIISLTIILGIANIGYGAVILSSNKNENNRNYYYKDKNGFFYKTKAGIREKGDIKLEDIVKTEEVSSNDYIREWFFDIRENKWCFKENKGYIANSWMSIDGDWYFFDDIYMHIGFLDHNGKIYYFDNEGKMQTGSILINNKVYTFDEKGVLKEEEEITQNVHNEEKKENNE